MAELMLEVKGVSKSFLLNGNKADSVKQLIGSLMEQEPKEVFCALKDVSFSLYEGEALGIIGENGAGKSTLLKVLSGISQPNSGEINFYGKVVSILEIGAGFHPELTGKENVYLAGALYGFSRSEMEKHYTQIVDFSDIGEFINEPVKNYSSGMYLRLAFSIITCVDADIYLIDEVINVGDANFQSKCKSRMEELLAAGKTMVIASHNLNEIVSLCNRVILMEDGKVVREGGNEVIQQYMTKALPQYFSFDKSQFFHEKKLAESIATTDGLTVSSVSVQKVQVASDGIDNRYPLEVSFVVEVTRPGTFVLRLKVYDSTGVLVFVCSSIDRMNEMSNIGSYKVEFVMPAGIFNARMYWADLSVINNSTQTVCAKVDKCVTFKMSDGTSQSELQHKSYMPGVMKPIVQTLITRL